MQREFYERFPKSFADAPVMNENISTWEDFGRSLWDVFPYYMTEFSQLKAKIEGNYLTKKAKTVAGQNKKLALEIEDLKSSHSKELEASLRRGDNAA